MHGEGVPQIMETRLEVSAVAALQADAIANDPEVAFRGVSRDGPSPTVEEEGRRLVFAESPGEHDAMFSIECQCRGELRPDRQEPGLEEFRVPHDEAVRWEVHIIGRQRQRLGQPQAGAVQQQDERAERLRLDARRCPFLG